MRQLLTILSMLAAATAAQAGVTKWVDAEGRVHYSDQPPPSAAKSQKNLDIKTSPASAQAPVTEGKTGEKSLAEKELEFRKRQVQAEEAAAKQAKAREEAKRKQENCIQARNQLQALQEGQRIVKYNEKGERVFLEDSARPQAIEEAQRTVDSWCK